MTGADAQADAHGDIHRVIDGRRVRTVFQPVIHLSSREVVGFEALSRGPEGSTLESPTALLSAARAVGRLGELDWVCRSAALEAAMGSAMHASLSWFLNVEAAGLLTPCPEDLLPVQGRASSGLRVVLELTERDVNGQVTRLLAAAEQARQSGWGVSLDDIGAESNSLALLPFLRPDVVKLDMRELSRQPVDVVASVTGAVRAYVERAGAVILAEGIEDEQSEMLARVFGATYGQGYHYGRPGPLPAAVQAPRRAIPLRQKAPPPSAVTPFEVLRAERTSWRTAKATLLPISAHLERQGQLATGTSVLLSCFQRDTFFTPARAAEYQEFAQINAYTVAAGQGLAELQSARLRFAALAADNGLADEWIVLVLGPHFAAALVARDCGDAGADHFRRFDFIYTYDRPLVVEAARSFLFHIENPDLSVLRDSASDGGTDGVPPGVVEHAKAAPVATTSKSRWRRT